MDYEISGEALVELGEKLDEIGEQLTERERAVLLLIFKLAGEQVEIEEAEVEGFAAPAPRLLISQKGPAIGLSQGFRGSFAPTGPTSPGSLVSRPEVIGTVRSF